MNDVDQLKKHIKKLKTVALPNCTTRFERRQVKKQIKMAEFDLKNARKN